jgi:hypothetical protein
MDFIKKPQKKNDNAIPPILIPKKYQKWYAILPGVVCWLTATYAIIQLF